MENQEIMNVTENEDIEVLDCGDDVVCEDSDSGSLLGTIVKVGIGIGVGFVAGKVIEKAKPKFQELKDKRAKRKADKAEAKASNDSDATEADPEDTED